MLKSFFKTAPTIATVSVKRFTCDVRAQAPTHAHFVCSSIALVRSARSTMDAAHLCKKIYTHSTASRVIVITKHHHWRHANAPTRSCCSRRPCVPAIGKQYKCRSPLREDPRAQQPPHLRYGVHQRVNYVEMYPTITIGHASASSDSFGPHGTPECLPAAGMGEGDACLALAGRRASPPPRLCQYTCRLSMLLALPGLYSSLPAAITTAGVRGIFHVAQRAALQSDRGWRIAPSAHFLQHLSQMKPGHGEAWKEQCRIHSL